MPWSCDGSPRSQPPRSPTQLAWGGGQKTLAGASGLSVMSLHAGKPSESPTVDFRKADAPGPPRDDVVKITPREGEEHSALALLQHTHIVPLYWVQDVPDRHLRLLGMPYLGGATLAQVLDRLRGRPSSQWRGRDLLEALDAVQAQAPL